MRKLQKLDRGLKTVSEQIKAVEWFSNHYPMEMQI